MLFVILAIVVGIIYAAIRKKTQNAIMDSFLLEFFIIGVFIIIIGFTANIVAILTMETEETYYLAPMGESCIVRDENLDVTYQIIDGDDLRTYIAKARYYSIGYYDEPSTVKVRYRGFGRKTEILKMFDFGTKFCNFRISNEER